MTVTVTALRWLSREILPYALLRVIDLWWLYALLGVINLWWLYGWHVGVTALVAFCGTVWFALYKKMAASPSRRGQVPKCCFSSAHASEANQQQPAAKASAKLFAAIPRAAALYREHVARGLDGNSREP
jgi:hypothetical protein